MAKVHIVTIGDEILVGQIRDTNGGFAAAVLTAAGFEVMGIVSCRDEHRALVTLLEPLVSSGNILILSGGLGPTRDDVTKTALAEVLGKPLQFNRDAYAHIEAFFSRYPAMLKPAHRQQAMLPEGVHLLTNDLGTAMGMWYDLSGGGAVVALPGVPYEFEHLLQHQVLPRLTEIFDMRPVRMLTAKTAGVPETEIELRLQPLVESLPEGMDISFLPDASEVRIRLTLRDPGSVLANPHWENDIIRRFETLLGPDLYGWEQDSLEEVLGREALARSMTLAVAESCTGGLLAHRITRVPGSSAYFTGGVVAYSNNLKTGLLDVDPNLIKRHGAVSEQVVSAMLKGVLNTCNADAGIATSGIAGPSGGTPEKPVGTIWVAWGTASAVRTRMLSLRLDRQKNIAYTAGFALNALRKFLRAM